MRASGSLGPGTESHKTPPVGGGWAVPWWQRQLGPAGSAPALGIGHFPGNGLRTGWDTGLQVSLTQWMHSWARQGCKELENGPAVALLGQVG